MIPYNLKCKSANANRRESHAGVLFYASCAMDILAHIDSHSAGCPCIAAFGNHGGYYFLLWFTGRRTKRSRSFFWTRPRKTLIVMAASASPTRLCAAFLFADVFNRSKNQPPRPKSFFIILSNSLTNDISSFPIFLTSRFLSIARI